MMGLLIGKKPLMHTMLEIYNPLLMINLRYGMDFMQFDLI